MKFHKSTLDKRCCFAFIYKGEKIEKNFADNRKKCLTKGKGCGNLIKLSAKRECVVPCKLNNAKTNKTPWTINELFKFRVNEFKPTKILE